MNRIRTKAQAIWESSIPCHEAGEAMYEEITALEDALTRIFDLSLTVQDHTLKDAVRIAHDALSKVQP